MDWVDGIVVAATLFGTRIIYRLIHFRSAFRPNPLVDAIKKETQSKFAPCLTTA